MLNSNTPRSDSFRNADESEHITETKEKSAHQHFPNCLPWKNTESENKK